MTLPLLPPQVTHEEETPQNVPKTIPIVNVTCAFKNWKISASLAIQLEINILHLVSHLFESGILERLIEIYKRVMLLYKFL